jgi:hypothetical protein
MTIKLTSHFSHSVRKKVASFHQTRPTPRLLDFFFQGEHHRNDARENEIYMLEPEILRRYPTDPEDGMTSTSTNPERK